ncbi:MAG: hypothetical protein QOE31_572 [Solirubrobacteraceae bacterium]|nr:hypothetical protein [Solirubrobacteraceae bacterium]
MRRSFVLSALLLLCLPAVASAAEVHVTSIGSGYKDSTDALLYTAAPGERNRIVVAHDPTTSPTTIVVRDSGAQVLAGGGCSAIDAQTVRCVAQTAFVDAGDGDDTLTTPASGPAFVVRGGDGADTLTGAGYLSGGPGDDVLTASPLTCMGPCPAVTLDGGSGNDVLRGGPGDDVLSGDNDGRANPFVGDASETGPLDAARGDDAIDGGPGRDTVRYTRTTGVRVDLADHASNGAGGERDRLQGIENVTSGDGADVLVGDDGANELIGGSGADTLVGRGGDDSLHDERLASTQDFLPPTAPDGADTLRGGAGNDGLDGGGEPGDRLFGGPGNDYLANDSGEIVARTVSCGSGADRVGSSPSAQLVSSCEVLKLNIVRLSMRPDRRPGGGLRFTVSCNGLRGLSGCDLTITLRLGSARVARRSLKIADRARQSFLLRPVRPVRRGAVLHIAISGQLSKTALSQFSARWRVRV